MNEFRPTACPPRRRAARAIGLCAAVAVIAATGWLAGTEPASNPAVSVEPIPAPKAVPRDNAATAYLGVSGCTAAACHGGQPTTDPRRQWQSSYTIWASSEPRAQPVENDKPNSVGAKIVDKHNRAYATLFDKRSKRIVQLLDQLPDLNSVKPERDARCTICHSVPVDPKTAPPSLLADGVGCECCHGPAADWRHDHTLNGWLADFHAGRHQESKLRHTRDLLTRVQFCASCHVGDGRLGRDVNHDLIAAGHPRLNFQFPAYLAVMPKHWADTPGAEPGFRTDSQTHLEAWAIGELVSAEAALRLLAARAASAERQSAASATAKSAPWPEFAEYGCYACHHQLSDKRALEREKTFAAAGRPAGSLPWTWGTWYFARPELRLLLESDLFGKSPEAKQSLELIDQLRDEMSKAAPSPTNVQKTAGSAADALATLAKLLDAQARRLERPAWDARAIDDLLARAADEQFVPADWDEAAQRFLTIESLWKAHEFAHRPSMNPGVSAVPPELESLRRGLQFPAPPTADKTVPGGTPAVTRIDSPANFDSEEIASKFKSAAAEIQKLLREGGAP